MIRSLSNLDDATRCALEQRTDLCDLVDDLAAMLERVCEAEFGYGMWPSEAEIRAVLERAKR